MLKQTCRARLAGIDFTKREVYSPRVATGTYLLVDSYWWQQVGTGANILAHVVTLDWVYVTYNTMLAPHK